MSGSHFVIVELANGFRKIISDLSRDDARHLVESIGACGVFDEGTDGEGTFYPAHRIDRVKIIKGEAPDAIGTVVA